MVRYRSSLCDAEEEVDACCAACALPQHFVAEFYERRATFVHVYLLIVGGLICLIGLYAWFYEKWSLLWSLYFASYVSLGVGYGDLRIHEAAVSWLSLSVIELTAVLVVGSVLSVAVSALFLTDQEEDWVTVHGAHLRMKKSFLCLGLAAPVLIASIGVVEGWTFSKSFYWFIDTTTTVGCGYAAPGTKLGRLICIAALLVVSPLFLTIFSTIVLYPHALLRHAKKKRVVELYDANGKLPDDLPDAETAKRDSFVLQVLIDAKLLDEEDIADANALFDRLQRRQ